MALEWGYENKNSKSPTQRIGLKDRQLCKQHNKNSRGCDTVHVVGDRKYFEGKKC